jgi:putative CocE/NonD family hydrolase
VLAFEPPRAGEAAYDAYVADPAHPVPNAPRPDDGSGWSTWLLQDQRFVDGRPDVRSWQTAPLAEDLVVAGDMTARLVVSTSGRDADWVVKLIDVLPDSGAGEPRHGGYQRIVGADVLRGRYREGFARAVPFVPGRPTAVEVDLHQQLYRFRRGHRIMVQVQSTWFPLYDRNPQSWVANIFAARAADFVAREHRVWHAPGRASRVVVSVLPGG